MIETTYVLEKVLDFFERFILLVTGVTLVAAMLYVAGNYQDFSHETQRFLLELVRTTGGIALVAVLPVVPGEIIFCTYQRRWLRLRRIGGLLLAGAMAGIILLGSTAILVLQQPL